MTTAVAGPQIEHVVLYALSNPQDAQQVIKFLYRIMSQATRSDGTPYIRSLKCGTTRPSAPVRSQGYNFVTVSVFDLEEDRAYYVKQDLSHLELIEFLEDKLVKGPAVLDFVDGLADVNITS